jgi:hypothetical protein
MYVCMYVCVCMYVYMYVYMYECVCMYVRVCLNVCMYVCMLSKRIFFVLSGRWRYLSIGLRDTQSHTATYISVEDTATCCNNTGNVRIT